jgi:hypothetical protein
MAKVADATAAAAEAAYDRVADQEARQRTESLDGTNAASSGGSGGEDAAAAATAAANLGASLVRGVTAAAGGGAGGSAALSGARSNLGAAASSSARNVAGKASASQTPTAEAPASQPQDARQEAQQPEQARLLASEAVLHQRTYFTPVMFAYMVGLVGAFVANDITGLGQPALLYIVPATLGAVILTGLQRGELGRLWNFTDVPSYGMAVKEDGKDEKHG